MVVSVVVSDMSRDKCILAVQFSCDYGVEFTEVDVSDSILEFLTQASAASLSIHIFLDASESDLVFGGDTEHCRDATLPYMPPANFAGVFSFGTD